MIIIGSPEWFREKAKTTKNVHFQDWIEDRRAEFLAFYSPEILAEMNGKELLNKVFGNRRNSMMQLLMIDEDYCKFGSTGKYKYLSIVYQKKDGTWNYKEGQQSNVISENEAEEKAIYIRDLLLEAIEIIRKSHLVSLEDYYVLSDRLEHIFFTQYSWAMKYYQMVFPYYFPGMYAAGRNADKSPKTLDRAIEILGLGLSKGSRIVKAGVVSLFIRRCDINNIVFNEIYEAQWGWDKPFEVCPNARDNYAHRNERVAEPNLANYLFLPRVVNVIEEHL